MKNENLIIERQNGKPLKKILNFDEESYSLAARADFFPTRVKVPKQVFIEKTDIKGYPYFIDYENCMWSASGNSVFKKNIDTGVEESVINGTTLDPLSKNVEFCMRTINGNIIISTTTSIEDKTGGKLHLSKDNGNTWQTVLDLDTQGVVGYIRNSSIWYYQNYGLSGVIFAGTYGYPQDDLNTKGNNMIFVSRDGGETWVKIYELPLIQPGTNNHIHSICVSDYNGWLWITHGDGLNKGILYSHDALYSDNPTFTVISKGAFGDGGWQPTAVVPTATGVAFGTDTGTGYPNGILAYDIPETSEIGKIGFKYILKHDDDKVHIARRGAHVNGVESYIVFNLSNPSALKIIGTGDGGFSWHEITTMKFGAFEKGMSNPDKEGWVYGAGWRLKVSWEETTRWVSGRYVRKIGYI